MTVPDFQTLMLPLLQIAATGEVSMKEARERLAAQFLLTPADLEQRLPSGKTTTFVNRVAWAKTYLDIAGLVESTSRGIFTITSAGRSILVEQPARIDMRTLERFPAYVAWRRGGPVEAPESTALVGPTKETSSERTPEERIESAHAALSQAVKAQQLERLRGSTWQFFERVIIDLLVAMGYGGGRAAMAQAFQKGGDEGLDGVVKEDELGLDVVYVQAKKYGADAQVGRPQVQGFAGSLQGARASRGVFVTTASFSQPAIEFCSRINTRIILIDGQQLAELMLKYNVGVRSKQIYEVKIIDEDCFGEEI